MAKQKKSTRKFYKTVFQVVVLSEEPYDMSSSMTDIVNDITEGNCSGMFEAVQQVTLSSKSVAHELMAQGSSPEFFGLDEDGNEQK